MDITEKIKSWVEANQGKRLLVVLDSQDEAEQLKRSCGLAESAKVKFRSWGGLLAGIPLDACMVSRLPETEMEREWAKMIHMRFLPTADTRLQLLQ